MKPKICLYFWLMVLGTLLVTHAGQSDHIGSDISDDMLAELSNELTPFQCWVTSSYLAQRSSNPKVGQEIIKTGGHVKEFNCYEALTYWKEDVLPLSEGANEIKVDGYGLRSLAAAVAFAGREDLKDWLFTTFLNTKKNTNSGQWNYHHREVYMEVPEKAEDSKIVDFDASLELLSATEDLSRFVPTQAKKKEYDSRAQQYLTVVTYVVAFIIAFVIICFAITTLMVCIRPQRFRRHHVEEVGVEENDIIDGSNHPNSEGIHAKISNVKESSEPGTTRKVRKTKLSNDTESIASGANDEDSNANVQNTTEDRNNNAN